MMESTNHRSLQLIDYQANLNRMFRAEFPSWRRTVVHYSLIVLAGRISNCKGHCCCCGKYAPVAFILDHATLLGMIGPRAMIALYSYIHREQIPCLSTGSYLPVGTYSTISSRAVRCGSGFLILRRLRRLHSRMQSEVCCQSNEISFPTTKN